MKNKARLAFEMLEKEMEVISKLQMFEILGGTGEAPYGTVNYSPSPTWVTDSLTQFFGQPVTSSVDAEGYWTIKVGNADPIQLTFTLNEVVVTPNGSYVVPNKNGWDDIIRDEDDENGYYNSSGEYVPPHSGGGSGGGTGLVWTNYSYNDFLKYLVTQPESEYNSAGYNSAGFNTSGFNQQFVNLLDATGTTADAFAGVMDTAVGIAKMGDFAKEATELLQQFGKYAGPVGNILGILVDGIEIYQDGQMTRNELIGFLTDQIVGGIIGSVPIAGGILATLYDVSGGDDWVQGQIVNLIDRYFPVPVTAP